MEKIKIKGKDYIEVNERLKEFRSNKGYLGYSLETVIVSIQDGVCIMQAIIKDENDKIIATGTAYEKEGSSFINKTSYIENCETSAWGRALGNLGIGIDTSIASAEEVANAIANQNDLPWLTEKQKAQFIDKVRNNSFEDNLTPDEAFEKLKSMYKMKNAYKEEISQEINSDFNNSLK
jgi:hypothetical protein